MKTHNNKSPYFSQWTTSKLKRTYKKITNQIKSAKYPSVSDKLNCIGIDLELQKRTA
jgi:hypothetical protein